MNDFYLSIISINRHIHNIAFSESFLGGDVGDLKIGAEKDLGLLQFIFRIFLGNLSFSSVSFGSCGEEFVFLDFQLWGSSVFFFLPVLFDSFHGLVCVFEGGISESAAMGH